MLNSFRKTACESAQPGLKEEREHPFIKTFDDIAIIPLYTKSISFHAQLLS